VVDGPVLFDADRCVEKQWAASTCVEMLEGVSRQHVTAQVRKTFLFVADVVRVCSFVTVLCVWGQKGCSA
jgi:hypothetical protein